MNRIEEIDIEIDSLTRRLGQTTGRETEVYSRIVGYYRSLKNWNRGKREEFDLRRTFSVAAHTAAPPEAQAETKSVNSDATVTWAITDDEVVTQSARYELFVRPGCPNCPSMEEKVKQLQMPGSVLDVSTDRGIERAIELSIYTAPTVVFFDDQGDELSRSSSAVELAKHIQPAAT